MRTLEILSKLVSFNSISANSNLDMIAYIEDFLVTCGCRTHKAYDPTGKKAGIFATLGPEGQGVLLSAHTDVVPVVGQDWHSDPFILTRVGDKVFGRGTTDMKGYIASVLALVERASQCQLHEPLKVVFSYDEEIGCVGIHHIIEKLVPAIGQPRMCFVGEPTQMQVATGHKGKFAMRATFIGQSGHSALAPKFVNALHMAGDFMTQIRVIQSDIAINGPRDNDYDIPYATVHIGKLTGGVALNMVPERAEMTLECRHLASENPNHLLDIIKRGGRKAAETFQAHFPHASITVAQYNAYPSLGVRADAAVTKYAQSLTKTDQTIKVAFGTEAGVFVKTGIPTIVCGPGSMEGQGHKPNEFISINELTACDAMMDNLLADLKT